MRTRPASRRSGLVALAWLWGVGLMPAMAQAQAAAARPMPVSLQWRADAAHFDDGERIGLVSTALMVEPATGWWVGPAVVGAASGQRGGFFVLGGQVERRWTLSGPWRAQLGLMVGGGGGGGAPVGGGLMVNPSAGLLWDLGDVQAGLAWTRVGMPSGRLGSQQLGLVLNWQGSVRLHDPDDRGRFTGEPGRGGLGVDRLALTASRLRVPGRPGQDAQSVTLAGVRAERDMGPGWYATVESAAATQGGADGYMELLGGLGWQTRLSGGGGPQWRVGLRGALGMGGGGAVGTGGGALGKGALTWRWDWGDAAFIGLEAGAVRAPGGGYRARYAQWQAGWQLDHPDRPGPAQVQRLSWAASVQHLGQARRKSGERLDLDTLGIKVGMDLSDQFYLSGQAHSAVAGQAGAYSAGLAGVGWHSGTGSPWRLGAEALVGAAGGGGVDTAGGAVAQAQLYLARQAGAHSRWQIGLGRMRSQHGGLNSPFLDLSWCMDWGVAQR